MCFFFLNFSREADVFRPGTLAISMEKCANNLLNRLTRFFFFIGDLRRNASLGTFFLLQSVLLSSFSSEFLLFSLGGNFLRWWIVGYKLPPISKN